MVVCSAPVFLFPVAWKSENQALPNSKTPFWILDRAIVLPIASNKIEGLGER